MAVVVVLLYICSKTYDQSDFFSGEGLQMIATVSVLEFYSQEQLVVYVGSRLYVGGQSSRFPNYHSIPESDV